MNVHRIPHPVLSACLLFGGALPLTHAATTTPASASREIEAKVALEASLEKRLQAVLQRVLGTEDVIVMVNVETLTASEAAEAEILPGVPIKDTLAGDRADSTARTMVKSISADILVDQSASEADLQLVRKTADDILAVKPQRGDRVTVRKMDLKRSAKAPAGRMGKAAAEAAASPLGNSWLVSGLWLLLVFVAVVLVYSRFLKPLLNVMREMIALQASVAAKPPAAAPAEAAPAATTVVQAALPQAGKSEGEEGAPEALPFSFLEERHLPMLKVLMRTMDSRMAAVVIQYVPSALASQLLQQMAPAMRQQVVKHMSKVVQLQEKDVKAIEHDVRKRIEYLMGGEDKLASILESSPTSLQEEVLKTVADEDQNLSARLSHRMILIEDIALLESNELKILTRRIPVQSLAAVLKSNEALRSQLLPKLTGGLAAWLSQEIELSQQLPPDALNREQKKVLTALTQLVHEGKITFKKGAEGSPDGAGPEDESVQVLDLGLTAPEPRAPAAAPAPQTPVIHVSVAAPQQVESTAAEPPKPRKRRLPPEDLDAEEEPAPKRKGNGKTAPPPQETPACAAPEPQAKPPAAAPTPAPAEPPKPAPAARAPAPVAEEEFPAENPDDPLDMGTMPPGTKDSVFDELDFPELGSLPGESPSAPGAFDFLDLPEPPSKGTS